VIARGWVARGHLPPEPLLSASRVSLEVPPVAGRQERNIPVLVEFSTVIDRSGGKQARLIPRVSKRTLESPSVVSVEWGTSAEVQNVIREVRDRPIPTTSTWTRAGCPRNRRREQAGSRRAGVKREGAHRKRTAGHRRAGVMALRAAARTWIHTFTLEQGSCAETIRIAFARGSAQTS